MTIHAALERIARSAWGGRQSIGACHDPMTRLALLTRSWARPVRSQPDYVVALTLAGFREIERHRATTLAARRKLRPVRTRRAA